MSIYENTDSISSRSSSRSDATISPRSSVSSPTSRIEEIGTGRFIASFVSQDDDKWAPYQMNITGLGVNDQVTEVFARNNKDGTAGVSSSERHSGHVTQMRSVENAQGSVDCFIGRASDLATAKEMAEFAFLSQMKLFINPNTKHLAQGIKEENGEYQFTFTVH